MTMMLLSYQIFCQLLHALLPLMLFHSNIEKKILNEDDLITFAINQSKEKFHGDYGYFLNNASILGPIGFIASFKAKKFN